MVVCTPFSCFRHFSPRLMSTGDHLYKYPWRYSHAFISTWPNLLWWYMVCCCGTMSVVMGTYGQTGCFVAWYGVVIFMCIMWHVNDVIVCLVMSSDYIVICVSVHFKVVLMCGTCLQLVVSSPLLSALSLEWTLSTSQVCIVTLTYTAITIIIICSD